jgi:heme exporter protein A
MRLIAEGITGERGGTELFRDVSFVLGPGEGLVLTGPNGAGKSTLLRILAGLLRPSAGLVQFLDDKGEPANEPFHFLSAQNAMKDQLSTLDNLGFWKDFLPSSGPGITPQAALERVGLAHTADLPFGYLSTGQRRRAALARLLVSHRPVWLTDEPTSGLDKASESLFAGIASEHLKSGGILIAATHLPLGISGLQQLVIGGDA